MKINHIAGLALAGMCAFTAANAFAEDTVAVMKIDALGSHTDIIAESLLKAVQDEIENSDYILDANGSDITYTEMQMVTGCDREASIACYDAACETLGSPAIIFGSVSDDAETHLVWYISGKGIFREVKGKADNDAAVKQLAKNLVIGEMGKLIVTSNVPDADVFIDGKLVGKSVDNEELAVPIELVTGNYIVAVRKEGFSADDAMKVTIDKDNVAKVHIEMTVARDPEEIRQAIKIAGYASLGAGAAAMIAGGVTMGIFHSKNNEMNDNIRNGVNRDYSDDNESGKKGIMAGNIIMGIGGFFAAAGVALVVTGFLYDFSGENVDAAQANTLPYMPDVNVSVTPEYQGMTLGWSF